MQGLLLVVVVQGAHGFGALLQTALPGGLPLWLEARLGGCN